MTPCTVPHARLIVKLVAHGVEAKLLRWIEEWLKGRKQRVFIGGRSLVGLLPTNR